MGISLSLIYMTIFGPIIAVILWLLVCVVRYLTTDKENEYLRQKRKDQIITPCIFAGVLVGVVLVIVIMIFLISHTG